MQPYRKNLRGYPAVDDSVESAVSLFGPVSSVRPELVNVIRKYRQLRLGPGFLRVGDDPVGAESGDFRD